MRALPTALLLLLFATPSFAAATTPHDPFRALAMLVPKPPEEPICCLKPSTPLEPDDDDLFLSFEQWKERRLAEATPREHTGAGGQNGGGSAGTGESPPADAAAAQNASTPPSGDAAGAGADVADSAPPPHFRVPLTDRFNYASLDCSARVHTAHRAAQSAANILSSKKDRYMLSPCAAPTYVVVELCEDIRIDTVQLANFEFFSGVFKEFRVSVRKTYATDLEGWTEVGTYVAKNVRGVQSFHPPTSLRDFYRFIRIDFLSHYGNEYYCPISLLRVYGLTHLEEWKWDVWEEESRAKLEHIASAVNEELPQPVQTENASEEHTGEHPGSSAEFTETADLSSNETRVSEPTQIPPSVDAGRSTDIVRSKPPASEPSSQAQDAPPSSSLLNTLVLSSTAIQSPDVSIDAHTPDSISSNTSTTDTITSISTPSPSPSDISNTPPSESSHPVHNVTSIPKPTISLTSPSPALHPVSSGESIYRTIMNRLSALEANHTLYARYVSDQTSGLRSVLRRLGEDVGRLEGLGRAQAQGYQRAAREFERQRRRMEEERRELLMKVDYLAEEIVLEKRLGIAQLCLLLAVLVFLGLTRGSRPETFDARGSAVRAWGRRKLSLSGDWVSRFRGRSRSRTLTPSPPSHEDEAHLATPTDSAPFPTDTVPFPSATRTKPRISVGVSATPPRSSSSRRTPRTHHATPPASARPGGLQRSNSQGAGPLGPVLGPVPRSAKRWARSAHLHEVRRVRGEAGDVFVRSAGAGPADADKWAPEVRSGSPLRVVTNRVEGGARAQVARGEEDGEGEVWVDTDADADADGSEGGWS